MRRRILAMLLAAVLLLCGCVPANTNPGATTGSVVEPTQPTENTGPYPAGREDVFCQLLPEQVDAPEGVKVLKWLLLGSNDYAINYPFGKEHDWSESAVRELNRLAEQLELPFRIQFVIFTTTCRSGLDWFRVPEVLEAMGSCDLITGMFTQGQMAEHLLTLTAFTDDSLKNTVHHPIAWNITSAEGEVYGIPCNIRYPRANGWIVEEEIFSGFGFKESTFGRAFWEMDLAFAQIYEANGRKGFLMPLNSGSINISKYNGILTQLPTDLHFLVENRFECIGACFAIDYSGEKPRVVNILRTQYVRETLQAMHRYKEKGYYAKSIDDALLDYSNCYTDSVVLQESSEGTWYRIPVETFAYRTGGDPMLIGILKESENVPLAMTLLNQLGENEQFRHQLLLGIEGKDYAVVDGVHETLEREDGCYDMRFLSALWGFDLEAVDVFGDLISVKDGQTHLDAYREVVEASQVWPVIPFDYSTIMKETEGVLSVLDANKYSLSNLAEEPYEMLLQSIRDAGEEYIIAELQRQLEAWLEANPKALG